MLDFVGVSHLLYSFAETDLRSRSAMSLSHAYGPANDAESLQVLAKAVNLGCTFWDTAHVYGMGHNEELLGQFFMENPGTREKVFVGSKCGFDVSDASLLCIMSKVNPPPSSSCSHSSCCFGIPSWFSVAFRSLPAFALFFGCHSRDMTDPLTRSTSRRRPTTV